MEPTAAKGLAGVRTQVAETSPADAEGIEALPMGRLESTKMGSGQRCRVQSQGKG
jgi:hypothetical protein